MKLKPEILIISKYEKTADLFLVYLADELRKSGIENKLDRRKLTLETNDYVVIGKSVNSICIGRSWHLLDYYFVYEFRDAWVDDNVLEREFVWRFKKETKRVHSKKELIEIIMRGAK